MIVKREPANNRQCRCPEAARWTQINTAVVQIARDPPTVGELGLDAVTLSDLDDRRDIDTRTDFLARRVGAGSGAGLVGESVGGSTGTADGRSGPGGGRG